MLLGDFLEHRQGDRVGLILFGSQAYLQAPLTFDRKTVRVWLDEARIGIAGKNTAIGDAIGLALKRLRLRPAQSRVLVLVTDGANNAGQIDPATAARLAAGEGVKIYPIGIGADPDKGATSILGLNPSLDLDEPALREIAEITGGQYFRARDGAELEQNRQGPGHPGAGDPTTDAGPPGACAVPLAAGFGPAAEPGAGRP
jgi:Ca-activated chloride channel family protein